MDFIYRTILLKTILILLAESSFSQPVEIRTYYDDQKSVIKEIYYIDDSSSAVLCGAYTSYFMNGAKEKQGFYKDNFPDSAWTYYYENGQVKMKGMLHYGSSHGLWEYYYENGSINMAGIIIDSKREGTWKYYYENGKIKSQGAYLNNKKDGIWNYFYEDGELKAQAYYKDSKGRYKEFYADGKLKAEGVNVLGQSDSTWVFYHENGKIKAIGAYQLGKRIGPWIYYHDNEEKSAEGSFKNGVKEGKWIYYHNNGKISSEGALREGKKEGYWKIFGRDGLFKAEGVFKQNDGKYTEYYESGKIKAEGNIIDGKNHGRWIYYYEDGAKEGECEYVNGDGEYVGFYPDGRIKMKGKIKDGINVGVWELYKGDGSLAGYYRPYYENNKPVYKLVEKKAVRRGDYVKPEYKYKSYKSRYFDPVINEYKGIIIATNPFGTFLGQLPFSFEYYIEERLGYEILATILRDPFYKSSKNVELNKVYNRGFNIALRQKFYHPEGKLGMFYFGHEVRLTSLNHYANVIDSLENQFSPETINAKETKFEYALFVGDRWMRLIDERYNNNTLGFTVDAYVGFGFGYRLFNRKYPNHPDYDAVFKDVNDSKFSISPRLGLNIGIVF
ncbi:MAG: membrane-binding protein [Cytophagales bacterium]|nr:membrane-binding protein [Cytophagales bacterium]